MVVEGSKNRAKMRSRSDNRCFSRKSPEGDRKKKRSARERSPWGVFFIHTRMHGSRYLCARAYVDTFFFLVLSFSVASGIRGVARRARDSQASRSRGRLALCCL